VNHEKRNLMTLSLEMLWTRKMSKWTLPKEKGLCGQQELDGILV
jgi:hypothetical protein